MKQTLLIISTVLLLSLSLFVRTTGLESSPPSLNFDEAALGYNAYSLLLTGKDEYGTPYPVSLRSFNDFKPALYSYLSIPFIHLFGLTQTTTRIVSAISGSISLIFLLFIFKKITSSSWAVSLAVTAFISFLPWRLHFSRVAFEANLSMSFFTIAIWSLLNFHKKPYRFLTFLFSLLAIYSYHSARLAIPLLLLLFLIQPSATNLNHILRHLPAYIKRLWPLPVIFLFSLPILFSGNNKSVLRRFQDTNIFSHFYPYTPKELIITSSPWTNWPAHPFYYLAGTLTGHVSSSLSPRNLGLTPYPWFTKSAQSISGTGMLGPLAGILFIFGFYLFLNRLKSDKNYHLILYWFISGIAPAALTWEWFHPLRSLNIYPAIEIITGLSLIYTFNKIRLIPWRIGSLTVMTILISTLLVSSIYNTLNEFNYSIWDTHGEFQPGGYKEGAALLESLKDKYSTVYIDSPHAQNYIFFLFYMKYPPQNIQSLSFTRPPVEAQGILNFNFDNFVYKKFHWPEDKNRHDFVYWTSSEIKEEEITSTPGAKLYKITDPFGRWVTSIITKE